MTSDEKALVEWLEKMQADEAAIANVLGHRSNPSLSKAAALIRRQAEEIDMLARALNHFYQGWHAPQSVLDKHAAALAIAKEQA